MKLGIRRNCFHWLLLAFLGLVVLGILAAYNGPHSAVNQKIAATNVAQEALDRGQFTFAKANIEGAQMVITGNALSQELKLAACSAAQTKLKEKLMLGLPGVVARVSCNIMAPGDTAVAQATLPKTQPETKQAAESAMKAAELTATECQAQLAEVSRLGVVQFGLKSANIAVGSNILDKVAEHARTCPQYKIEIGGHTDSGGDAAMNMRLSQQRADSVRSYLINKGVAGERLIAKGFGETKPLVADNAVIGVDSQDRAKNRRIEFNIIND